MADGLGPIANLVGRVNALHQLEVSMNGGGTAASVHLDGSSAYTGQALIPAPGVGFRVVLTNLIASKDSASKLNYFLTAGARKVGPFYLSATDGTGMCSGPIRIPLPEATAVTLTSIGTMGQSFEIGYQIEPV